MSRNPFAHHLRLKRPCKNCPFRVEGAIELEPGRLQGIIDGLLMDDMSTFQCHETTHGRRGGEWDDEGGYTPSGDEAMCAGAASLLIKRGRPTVAMRMAFVMGVAKPQQWDSIANLVIE